MRRFRRCNFPARAIVRPMLCYSLNPPQHIPLISTRQTLNYCFPLSSCHPYRRIHSIHSDLSNNVLQCGDGFCNHARLLRTIPDNEYLHPCLYTQQQTVCRKYLKCLFRRPSAFHMHKCIRPFAKIRQELPLHLLGVTSNAPRLHNTQIRCKMQMYSILLDRTRTNVSDKALGWFGLRLINSQDHPEPNG